MTPAETVDIPPATSERDMGSRAAGQGGHRRLGRRDRVRRNPHPQRGRARVQGEPARGSTHPHHRLGGRVETRGLVDGVAPDDRGEVTARQRVPEPRFGQRPADRRTFEQELDGGVPLGAGAPCEVRTFLFGVLVERRDRVVDEGRHRPLGHLHHVTELVDDGGRGETGVDPQLPRPVLGAPPRTEIVRVQAASHQVASELQNLGVDTRPDPHTGVLQGGRQPMPEICLTHVTVGRRELRVVQQGAVLGLPVGGGHDPVDRHARRSQEGFGDVPHQFGSTSARPRPSGIHPRNIASDDTGRVVLGEGSTRCYRAVSGPLGGARTGPGRPPVASLDRHAPSRSPWPGSRDDRTPSRAGRTSAASQGADADLLLTPA